MKVNSGEKIGFVGVNGGRKTTLFKIIAGLTSYEDGIVSIPTGVTVGYLEQHPLLNTDESIMDILLHVFDGLIELEQKLRIQEERLSQLENDAEKYESQMALYGNMLDEFEQKGGYRYKSDIKGVLRGLGFLPEEFVKKYQSVAVGREQE